MPRNGCPWRPTLLWALLLCGVLGAAAPAAAQTGLQADLARQLALAGPHDGAYVYDITAGQALFAERASTLRPPASVEKLYTATAALARLGPAAQLSTTVFGVGHLAAGGLWEGNLYLRGDGDPTFGSSAFIRRHYGGLGASVSALVTQLVRIDGIRRISGAILGDESYLDPLRGEPSSGYAFDPFLEGRLSALAFNRGETGSERGRHAPAAFAARRLWAALKAAGVIARGHSGAAATPAGAQPLASVASPTTAQLLGLMLPPSDNFFAETLLKDLGASFAGAGSTAAGASVVLATLSAMLPGIDPRILDGSGLSPADRSSPLQIVQLLVALAATPIGAVVREHLAVAGRSGTLALRMRRTAAQGRCEGKTGTLTGASNLVGYCQSVAGHELAFAVFTDGISIEAAHTFQDHIAISLASSNFTEAKAARAQAASVLSPPLLIRRQLELGPIPQPLLAR